MAFKEIKLEDDTTIIGYIPDSKAITEDVYEIIGTTPNLDPDLGTIQIWNLTDNSTPVDTLTSGQSLTLHLTPSTYNVTWPTSTIIGSWPLNLNSSLNIIILWKVGTTLYRMYGGFVI